MAVNTYQFTVDAQSKDQRLDVFLTAQIPDLPSRSFIQKMIDQGLVTVNGQAAKRNTRLVINDEVKAILDESTLPKTDLVAEQLKLDIFYEDDDIVIVNKPEGLTVHPASGDKTGTLVNGLLFHFGENLSDKNGDDRPGIVHRLDRDTSGLLLVAKNNTAHARLGRQFEKHTIYKKYIARVEGIVQFDQGMIDVPLERHRKYHDQRQVAKPGEGKEAVTLYQVLQRFKKTTLVALYPQTGRTHQLRVHMKHLGHPLLGDEKYGLTSNFPRLALHAMAIGFEHPTMKEQIEFSCPAPEIFADERFS